MSDPTSDLGSDDDVPAGGAGPESEAAPVRVPYDALSAEALQGVIESFVLREGTDYGPHEYTLAEKVGHVRGQLARGDAHVVWDPNTQSVAIVVERAARGL
jgi:uncharacterized protein YheU (UPF0270 family)